METILEETVDTEDLKKFEQKYHLELNNGKVDTCLCVDFYCAHMSQESTKVYTVFQIEFDNILLNRSRQILSLSMLGVW